MARSMLKIKSPVKKRPVGRPVGKPQSAKERRAKMLTGAKLHLAAKLRKAGSTDAKALTDSALADAAESQALNVRMIAKANEAKAQLQLRRLQLESGEMIKKETAVAYMSNLFRMIRRNLDAAPEMIGMLSDVQPGEVERLRFLLLRVTDRIRKKLAEIPAIITEEILPEESKADA